MSYAAYSGCRYFSCFHHDTSFSYAYNEVSDEKVLECKAELGDDTIIGPEQDEFSQVAAGSFV